MALVCVIGLGGWWCARMYYGDSSAPLDVVPNRWRAFLSITGRDPAIKVEMTVNILKTSPGRPAIVRLFPEGTVFKNAELDGAPLSPVKKDGWHCAVIPGSGRFILTADIEIKPVHDSGIKRLVMQKPDFIQSILEVDSSKAWEVNVPGVQGRIAGSPSQGTHGVLQLGQGGTFTVEWREPRPEVERVGTPSVVPSVAWTIGERTLTANALLNVNILGGPREQMTILLPKNSGRVKLAGAAVRDFRLNENKLAVFFREKFTGMTDLSLSFEVQRQPGDTVACPALEVEEGHAEAGGWIMVINDAPGLLLENRSAGLLETSDLDIPAAVLGLAKGKPLYFYQSTARGAEPVFDVMDRMPFPIVETIADKAEIFVAVQPGGEEITRIHYTIRNNSRQFLRINLPAWAELFSVEVDNKPCTISKNGKTHLVPLVKSIQTIGGLIPFPVEIVYCRQGTSVKDKASRVVDLPELPDVPIATVKAVVFSPETPLLKEYRSSLVKTTRWTTQEDLNIGMGRQSEILSPEWISRKLAREYYRLGITAYQENRLEDAEKLLRETGNFTNADPSILAQSKDLLVNIRAGRGEVNSRADRTERAKIQTIQKALARDNEQLQAQQEQLIAGGLANIDSGNEELGAELLKQADVIDAQLGQRNASRSRQQAVRRDYGARLSLVEEERRKNKELQQQYTLLQKKVQEIGKESGKKPEANSKGKALARGMLKATAKRNMNVAQIQAPDAYEEANQSAGDVSAGAEAQHIRNQVAVNVAQVMPVVKPAAGNDSLKARNDMLVQKVSALEEALSWTTSRPAQEIQQVDSAEVSRAKLLLGNAEQKLEAITTNLVMSGAVTLNDIAAERELTNLVNWVEVNGNTFGTLDEQIGNDFSNLQSRIKATSAELEKARKRRQAAETVDIPLAVSGMDNPGNREALANFLSYNYLPSEDNGRTLYRVEKDGLNVWNGEKNPEKLNDIMEKFKVNNGRVVSVHGAVVSVPLNDIPVANNWFSGAKAGNHRYTLLDEAQYRTLAQIAAAMQDRDETAKSRTGKKDVIVGTDNNLEGQAFKLVRTDADGNTFSIDGKDISVRHNQYLAIEDGNRLTVLKAGEVHNWQDEVKDLGMVASVQPRIELPQTGTPLYFEKTLLSAGESPDIEIIFQ